MDYLKVLKIFFKLKWEEIINSLGHDELLPFGLALTALAISICFLFYAVGYVSLLIYNPIPPNEQTHTISYTVAIGMMYVFLGILLYAIIRTIIKFCLWVAKNWREAKRLANERI